MRLGHTEPLNGHFCIHIMFLHLLDHVENRLVFPQPDVMIGNCHPLKCNTLRVLEKRVGSPAIKENKKLSGAVLYCLNIIVLFLEDITFEVSKESNPPNFVF